MAGRTVFLAAICLMALSTAVSAAQPRKTSGTSQPRAAEERPAPITILSIIPAQGEPGMTVTLNGSGFTEKTVAYLGSMGIPAAFSDQKQFSFEIPDLPPGLYALYLKREDGTTSKPYNFTLLPQKPVALSLTPDTVYSCSSGKEREVTISGKNFQAGSQVLFDGAALPSRFISPESVSFTAPQVNGGLHQVQVKNPSDTVSVPLALMIDSKPEIRSISQGEDFVSYYDLNIVGRNFQQNSIVAVDGRRLPVGFSSATEREMIIYGGCTRLIYQRHPYDATPKSFSIQVLNANGEESQLVSVNAP